MATFPSSCSRRSTRPTLEELFERLVAREGVTVESLYTGPAPTPLFLLAEGLLEYDSGFARWRFLHVQLVERIIGPLTGGTGGTLGARYLQRTVSQRFLPTAVGSSRRVLRRAAARTAASGCDVARRRGPAVIRDISIALREGHAGVAGRHAVRVPLGVAHREGRERERVGGDREPARRHARGRAVARARRVAGIARAPARRIRRAGARRRRERAVRRSSRPTRWRTIPTCTASGCCSAPAERSPAASFLTSGRR